MIRVLIADDAAVVRKILQTALESDPEISIAGVAQDGKEALDLAETLNPDLVILDVDMPRLSGLEVLTVLKKKHPDLPVIMFSSLVQKGSEVTIDAISLGADDYFCKPSTTLLDETIAILRKELVPRIIACHRINLSTSGIMSIPLAARKSLGKIPHSSPPEIMAIGVSAGGPEALRTLLTQVPAPFPVPALIVQHMPPGFTASLAEYLTTQTMHPVVEARSGMDVVPGRFYLAPGDFHMDLEKKGASPKIQLNHGPQENYCRPAVDFTLRSVARLYGKKSLAVILTGMGQDGLLGCREIHKAGGTILVQDKATSVVWGMPGSVYLEGLAKDAVSINQMAPAIMAHWKCSPFNP